MRNTAFILLSSVALAFALPANVSAADMRVKALVRKAPIVPPVYNWSGLYVGPHIGGTWSNTALRDTPLGVSLSSGGTGFIGGFQMGYNLQAGNFLYGVEGDFDWTTFSGTSGPAFTPIGMIQATARKDWITTLAARLGITSDRWLFYSKVGGGWVRGSEALSFVNGEAIWTSSPTKDGWLLGGGIEYAFASNWTGKLEYDYIGLTNSTVSTPGVTSVSHDIQMLKVGANYQFDNRVSEAEKSGRSEESRDTEALERRRTPSPT
jgi:opacity protein-like surface antigen